MRAKDPGGKRALGLKRQGISLSRCQKSHTQACVRMFFLRELQPSEFWKLFVAQCILLIVSVLDQMNSTELETFAAKLHAQMDRSPNGSEMPKVELEDVKGWIASHKKEAECYSELSFFLNLV